MRKPKALHPVPKPKPKAKRKHHHPGAVALGHSTGSASHQVRSLAAHHAGKPKKPKAKRPVRKLALGEMVACCSAEALAMSLRLSGWPVTDDDVLALYFYTASGPDDGASIEDALNSAARYGLAGSRPVTFTPAELFAQEVRLFSQGLLLGLALPEGPHAVLATDAGWWSWGELYDPAQFPGAIIEEAWAVTW